MRDEKKASKQLNSMPNMGHQNVLEVVIFKFLTVYLFDHLSYSAINLIAILTTKEKDSSVLHYA